MSNDELFHNFNRPPRLQYPTIPQEDIDIPAPPDLSPMPDQGWLVTMIPMAVIGILAIFYLLGAASGRSNTGLYFVIISVSALAGTVLAQRWRRKDHERRREETRIQYIRALYKKQVRLQAVHDAQFAILRENFPAPQAGLSAALSRDLRLWERRPDDPDFAALRLGVGRVPSPVQIIPPDPDLDSPDLERALRLADSYRFLNGAPVVTTLRQVASLGICGHREPVLSAARSMICGLALAHAPQDLQICLIAPYRDDWQWLEWLPHTSRTFHGGAPHYIAYDPASIRNLLGTLSQTIDARREHPGARRPHVLLVIDTPQLAENEAVYATLLREGEQVGASVICLTSRYETIPGECKAIVEIETDGRFRYVRTTLEIAGDTIDQLSIQDAEHIARALSAVSLRESGSSGRIPRHVDFLDLYGVRMVDDLRRTIHTRWQRELPDGVLPFPVPIGRESLAVETFMLLDEDHHGPHGVLAGTTGSGKSELLQTLVCALAVEHDPRLVNLLLIDFKGGSTFNVFANLPHTVGMVTNLDGALVERALEALKAETKYRQQLLKAVNMRDITQYHRYYARTPEQFEHSDYHPLPHLFIIVDEFAQLAREMPDFLRELVRTAQVGRSLGLHLILGTQSPMDVITEEMNANLQFRICLRVQNIEASRAMLRRPDAAYLPAGWPGRGYFQVGERGFFKEFQTAYVGGDYAPQNQADEDELVLELITDHGDVIDLLPDDTVSSEPALADEPYTTSRAISELVHDYAHYQGIGQMPPLLLPPLDERLTLADVFAKTEIGGWNGRDWKPAGRDHDGNAIRLGSAPVGILDDIYNRTQNPLWIHLNIGEQERATTERDGHVLILGGPGTGKTTLLRTLALSLALLHPPEKLHLYCLSFTGGGLNDLSDLPHAERVIHGTESERVRRLFGRLIHHMNERQAGRLPTLPTIVVFIDQYEQFRDTYYEQHMADFERLVNEGRAVGIYLVISASSITSVPDRLRTLVQQRIALQLGSPADYLLAVGHMNTQIERALPKGRGFIYNNPPLACQISLPVLMPIVNQDEAADHTRQIITELRDGYLALQGIRPAEAAPEDMQCPDPIRELPTQIPLDTLPLPQPLPQIITSIGRCDDDALSIYYLDWWEHGPHFVVTGPPASGKTNLLHAVALSAAQQHAPDKLRFLLVDFAGRSLRPLEPLKHVIARVTDPAGLQTHLAHLQNELAHQDGGSVYDLPKTVLLFDDYDTTSEILSGTPGILRQLRDHVRLHSDLGLHVWVAGYLERIGDPLMKQLLLRRSGFALSTKEGLVSLNVRAYDLPNEAMPQGRAYFAQHHHIRVIQTAWVDNVALAVNRINHQVWADAAPAAWRYPAEHSEPHTLEDTASPLDIDTQGLIQDLLGDDASHID